MLKSLAVLELAFLLTTTPWLTAPAQSGADFNGDGFEDLAIGAPTETVAGFGDDGAVNVIYGSASGLNGDKDQFWNQDSPNILDEAAPCCDHFGSALAWGDFDGDGFDDLAVGVALENITNTSDDAGAVNVLYGGPIRGLSDVGNQFWHRDVPGVLGSAASGGNFGAALAAGDFDGDGFDDLAVGVPRDDLPQRTGSVPDAGSVNVLYGSASGLTAAGDQLWSQNSLGIADVAEDLDRFGASLAAGDFDGDGKDDLAIGVPWEGLGTESSVGAGAAHVLYGSLSGLTATDSQLWTQDVSGVLDKAEADDRFGWSLAAGDFDGDGKDDLAVSAIQEDLGANLNDQNGGVNVLYGSPGGLSAAGDQFWSQNSSGILDSAEDDDFFGSALGTGDFDGDGFRDLVVGVELERREPGDDAIGAAHVLYGSGGGLSAAGDQLWTQDSPGVLETAEEGDRFGRAIGSGDYDGDGFDDLAIGAPGEPLFTRSGQHPNAGVVHVLHGGQDGVVSAGNQLLHQDQPGIADVVENYDCFGGAISSQRDIYPIQDPSSALDFCTVETP
jgi:hypothetical protein